MPRGEGVDRGSPMKTRSTMTGTLSGRLNAALKLPNGARFYRCALQVNPFAYLNRHKKQTTFRTEADYNAAIIAACQEARIEVIGVADHYRVQESTRLVQAARAAGLFAFSGFEAVTKDGVHFLCLFDPDKDNCSNGLLANAGFTTPMRRRRPAAWTPLNSFTVPTKKNGGQSALPRMLPPREGFSRSSPVKPASMSGSRRTFLLAPLPALSTKPRKAFGRSWKTRTQSIIVTAPSRS